MNPRKRLRKIDQYRHVAAAAAASETISHGTAREAAACGKQTVYVGRTPVMTTSFVHNNIDVNRVWKKTLTVMSFNAQELGVRERRNREFNTIRESTHRRFKAERRATVAAVVTHEYYDIIIITI